MKTVENVEFSAVRGRVMGAHVWSETHVKSSGGGVAVNGHGFSSSRTTSTVVNIREVCIQTDDGLQIIESYPAEVKALPGQTITLVRAAKSAGKELTTVAVINHSMQTTFATGKELFSAVKSLLFLSIPVTIAAIGLLVAMSRPHHGADFDGHKAFVCALLAGNLYWLRGPMLLMEYKQRLKDFISAQSGAPVAEKGSDAGELAPVHA